MTWIKCSLFIKLAMLILLGAAVVQFSVLWITHHSTRQGMLADQEKYFTALATSASHEIDHIFFASQKAVDETVTLFKVLPRTRSQAQISLKDLLQNHRDLYGSAIALAPDQDIKAAGYQILYSWKDANQLTCTDRKSPMTDYQSDWFYLPFHLKRPVWTDPYYDQDVGTLMVTYAAPVIVEDRVIAVIACDLTLTHIQTCLSNLKLGRQGDAILISQFGKLIIHPNPDWVHKETFYSLGESAASNEDRDTLFRLSKTLVHESAGSIRFKQVSGHDRAWLYYDTIASTGWRVGFIISERAILAPIRQLSHRTALISASGILLLLIPAFLVSLTLTRPLHGLCTASEHLASGEFDTPLPPVKSGDEIGRLITSFDLMRIKLKAYIKNLAATTAEKEKIASELAIARDIQHGILPKLFPPFPQRPGLDLYALLESAKEVGGDLYDFALLDDDHLYICIGDVSGKGIPASLFMAVSKTLLKSTIQTVKDPAQALYHVNNELAEANDTCMFVTTFCGILNLATHELTYASAGHNPPLVINQGQVDFIEMNPSASLAAFKDTEYTNQVIQLDPGSKLLLYTDGVTEAMNPEQIPFGEDRLVKHLKQDHSRTAEKCLSTLTQAIRTFAQGEDQSDDITLLCLSYDPKNITPSQTAPTASLTLTNHKEEIAKLVTWLERISVQLDWPKALLMQLNLVLEESVMNVITHAFQDDQVHEIELRLWQTDQDIRLELSDDGIPFDPTQHTAPDLEIPIEDRDIGGLGIHFIKKIMDDFTYERKDNMNVVTLFKTVAG